jgi:uncharacterized membrane protein (DUF4010 family)
VVPEVSIWPYVPTLARLALALAIGLFVGIERERRQKEAGVRTFAFAAVLGAVGGLLGDPFALLVLALLGVLVVLLNVETIRRGEGAEITTSAALLVTACAGVLAGQGHRFTPTLLGVATAALLAWKQPLAGFSHALTESELRSAILLAILTFVVYPILPVGHVDPWGLLEPRDAWVTVILVATLGFANYVLLKRYGARGVELMGFLGGFVNSTITVTELSTRALASGGRLADAVFRAVVLATAAMLLRNAAILGLLAPAALFDSAVPLLLMLAMTAVVVLGRGNRHEEALGSSSATGSKVGPAGELPVPAMRSPFSLTAALQFGAIFLALQIAGTLAQRALGHAGFYAVSAVGGFVSSASAVAAAANLAASGTLPPEVAGIGAILASLTSAAVNLPIVARLTKDRPLTRRLAWVLGGVILLGVVGAVAQAHSPLTLSGVRAAWPIAPEPSAQSVTTR